ncbi:hypothetical protein [Luteibacter aegosomatissinici]|uniref:hypothetical protein n=1 Tax=Luteibacter aegosomatissinici TaxID=2911539 RepID=UPI001FF8430F|nr:hypothetical protein [Luteibacter aegosomatissinici]UPG92801.1 hypothetical protein L2Y97_13095 [Luteibacter aegosomatissinici]
MTVSRRAPTARLMRTYFSDIGFVLRHQVVAMNAPERWWLTNNDQTVYPLPGGVGDSGEGEGGFFRTSQRLWRGWAANLARFEREAHCVALIANRLAGASAEERVEFDRWVRSEGDCFPDTLDGTPLDVDGKPVDETRWPWSAMRFSKETGQLESRGWPWDAHPVARTAAWDVLRKAGWAELAGQLSVFDVRSPAL